MAKRGRKPGSGNRQVTNGSGETAIHLHVSPETRALFNLQCHVEGKTQSEMFSKMVGQIHPGKKLERRIEQTKAALEHLKGIQDELESWINVAAAKGAH